MDMGCCNSEFHALCDRQVSVQVSDDRITRETLSYNNPCPSSPSSTIYIYIYIYIYTHTHTHTHTHTLYETDLICDNDTHL